MAGYTKLFNTIVTSSIWSEDDKTRIMWITMLATADSKGYVSGSIPGMAGIARMTLQEAETAIQRLCEPDPWSRTKDYDGRRLLECDGGWQIINYMTYRQLRDPEKRRKQTREAVRRYREKHAECKPNVSRCKPNVSHGKPRKAQAEAEAEAEAEEITKKENIKRKSFVRPSPEEVGSYAESINFELDGAAFVDYYDSKGWMIGKNKMKDWKAAVRTWKRNERKETTHARTSTDRRPSGNSFQGRDICEQDYGELLDPRR